MPKATILLADNDSDFLNTRTEFLEQAGYRVLKAYTLEQARQLLTEAHVHLAILDIRMENDDDEKDISGLTLAKDPDFRPIPKIILTAFPSYLAVREVLGPVLDGLPAAVDFLCKQEGPEAMIQAIERAFAEHVRINWDLAIRFAEYQSFHGWARQIIGKELSDDQLNDRAQEIEQLMRKMLYDYPDVFLDTIPTGRQGEVLAWVQSQSKLLEGRRLLKCSTREGIRAERSAFEKWGNVLSRERTLTPTPPMESVHFAAILYSISPDLEPVEWLAEYVQWYQAEEIIRVVEDFAKKASKSLYAQPCPPNHEKSLNALYKEQVGLTPEGISEQAFRQAFDEIAQYMQRQHDVAIDMEPDSNTITFYLKEGNLICPNPILFLYKNAKLFRPPVLCRYILGNMDGYNILVDRQGRTWLTDFATIGPAPTLSDFIALESKIRFEWVRTADLDQVCNFEKQLSAIGPLEGPLNVIYTNAADLDKALRVIARLRQWAANIPGADPLEYHLGILFRAARIIVGNLEPVRKAHALMGAAMICRSLEQSDAQT